MATTNSSTAKKTASKTVSEPSVAVVEEVKQKIKAKGIDVHEYIPVRNGFHGILVYRSSKTGENYQWDEFGDEQEMELQELKNAKSSAKAFFINNYFRFDEEYAWVIDYLGVSQYYKGVIDIDSFDEIFQMKPDALKDVLNKLPEAQKRSVSYRARQLIADGAIDSNKVISTLEECLGTELIEK